MSTEHTGQYIDAFEKRQTTAGGPGWLNDLRRAGMESFSELGFPTVKQEAWKYTNVQPMVALPFGLANG